MGISKIESDLKQKLTEATEYILKNSPCSVCEHDCYCKEECELKTEWQDLLKRISKEKNNDK